MYIEKIKSPADLKGLDIEALNIVADETPYRICSTTIP